MTVEKQKTTITLTRPTVRRLANLGDFGESYEDVVLRLIENTNEQHSGEKT